MARAQVPAMGPRPSAATNTTARISSGTARTARIQPRASQYTVELGETLRAARIPTGMDNTTPIAVDTNPIATVCAAASTRSQPSALTLGGLIRVNTSAAGMIQVQNE